MNTACSLRDQINIFNPKFNIAGAATAVAGFAAGTTHTPNYISVVGTTTATSGQATILQGGGGAGFIQASADF